MVARIGVRMDRVASAANGKISAGFQGDVTMQLVWLAIAIMTTAAYHLVLKETPPAASPFLSLSVTYLIGAGIFFAIYVALPGPFALRPSLHELNWTALALAAAVVFLDLAFLMLYRSGFNVSFGQLVTQSC